MQDSLEEGVCKVDLELLMSHVPEGMNVVLRTPTPSPSIRLCVHTDEM